MSTILMSRSKRRGVLHGLGYARYASAVWLPRPPQGERVWVRGLLLEPRPENSHRRSHIGIRGRSGDGPPHPDPLSHGGEGHTRKSERAQRLANWGSRT